MTPPGEAAVLVAALLVLVVLLAAGWALYTTALRVDRLHRQVLGSRATLGAQLVHRAQAAADVARLEDLDPASRLLVQRAAHEALDAEGPLVEDGLDPATRPTTPALPTRASGAAQNGGRSRAMIESDLSRVLRTVLDAPTRQALGQDPLAADALARLDRTCYRMTLARSFHNTHVAEARRLRSSPLVRLLRLAGHAPLPQTVDIDDDTTPIPASPQDDR